MLCPNRFSSVKMNLRSKGKQYTKEEDMCVNDSCEWGVRCECEGMGEVRIWG